MTPQSVSLDSAASTSSFTDVDALSFLVGASSPPSLVLSPSSSHSLSETTYLDPITDMTATRTEPDMSSDTSKSTSTGAIISTSDPQSTSVLQHPLPTIVSVSLSQSPPFSLSSITISMTTSSTVSINDSNRTQPSSIPCLSQSQPNNEYAYKLIISILSTMLMLVVICLLVTLFYLPRVLTRLKLTTHPHTSTLNPSQRPSPRSRMTSLSPPPFTKSKTLNPPVPFLPTPNRPPNNTHGKDDLFERDDLLPLTTPDTNNDKNHNTTTIPTNHPTKLRKNLARPNNTKGYVKIFPHTDSDIDPDPNKSSSNPNPNPASTPSPFPETQSHSQSHLSRYPSLSGQNQPSIQPQTQTEVEPINDNDTRMNSYNSYNHNHEFLREKRTEGEEREGKRYTVSAIPSDSISASTPASMSALQIQPPVSRPRPTGWIIPAHPHPCACACTCRYSCSYYTSIDELQQ